MTLAFVASAPRCVSKLFFDEERERCDAVVVRVPRAFLKTSRPLVESDTIRQQWCGMVEKSEMMHACTCCVGPYAAAMFIRTCIMWTFQARHE